MKYKAIITGIETDMDQTAVKYIFEKLMQGDDEGRNSGMTDAVEIEVIPEETGVQVEQVAVEVLTKVPPKQT